MAFAAVSSLLETLEDLLRFNFLALEINSLQTMIEHNQTGDHFIMDSVQTIAAKVLRPWRPSRVSRQELDRSELRAFKQASSIFYGRNTSPKITKLFAFEEVLLRNYDSIYTLKNSPYFLSSRANEISEVFHQLCFLLGSLEELSNVCNHHDKIQCLERRLTNLVQRIEDIIEGSIFDRSIISKAFNFIDGVLNVDSKPVIREVPFMTGVLEMFDKRSGVQVHLHETLMEILLIKQQMKQIYLDAPIVSVDLLGQSSRIDPLKHLPAKKNEVFDMDDDFLSILDRVIRVPSGLEMVAIVGMGGIGKTTLAQRVFDYPLTCHHFYVRAWVTVPQVHRVRDILIGLLRGIVQITDEIYGKSIGQLVEELYRSLKGKRFLIVLDSIWSTKAWDDVKRCFPNDKNGSRLVLTTRLKKVADYVNPKRPPHFVNLLDVDQSWKLLQQQVFGEEPCPLEFEDVGRRIARKCQGLPLAIVVIAGVLRKIMRTLDCWEGIAKAVSSIVSDNPEQCLEILALSYNHLPSHLKACFLYLGSFPQDCDIEVQKLISLWIAEGLLDKEKELLPPFKDLNRFFLINDNAQSLAQQADCIKGGYDNVNFLRSMQEILKGFGEPQTTGFLELTAEAYLEDLISRNVVLVGKRSFGGKIRTCRLHDLMHDLCFREAQKEKFMYIIRRDFKTFPEGVINPRRLCLHSNFLGHLDSVPPMPLVRSFLCFNLGFGSTPDTFSKLGFKLLRVLEIIFLSFQEFPRPILQLVHLRYLAFTATYDLPMSISDLKNLQTLIIHGPWIHSESGDSPILLFEYWNMPRLRHLLTTVACCLRNPFLVKWNLRSTLRPENMQSLSEITFSSCSKGVFALMPFLKKLGIRESQEDYISDESSRWLYDLVHLTHLEELKCSFYVQNGTPRNTLHWILPSSLKKLTLSWSYISWANMTNIAMLPKLEVLKLKNHAFQGPEWEPCEKGFRCLKHLLIENHDLVHWEASSVHFPSLEHLALRSCKSLEEIPFGIAEIPTIQLLELHYCSESAEDSAEEIRNQIDGLVVDVRAGKR